MNLRKRGPAKTEKLSNVRGPEKVVSTPGSTNRVAKSRSSRDSLTARSRIHAVPGLTPRSSEASAREEIRLPTSTPNPQRPSTEVAEELHGKSDAMSKIMERASGLMESPSV